MSLHWFTAMSGAVRAARRNRLPIVSLRLLGRLDDELSCANSRFFKTLLYPDERIHRLLAERAVLHWASVRAVPQVTVDFGDGRRLETTLAGNSVHVVLDSAGRPADALPGMSTPEAFADQLDWALECAARVGQAPDAARRRQLAERHRARLDDIGAPTSSRTTRARAASELAATKHMIERPILDALERSLEADTVITAGQHRAIHGWFADGQPVDSANQLVDRIYAELFLMPLSDPWLGLSPALFNGLADDGRRTS